MAGPVYHPRRGDSGVLVALKTPSHPTDASTWANPAVLARFVPDGQVPGSLNGVPFAPWAGPQGGDFEGLAGTMLFPEPPFTRLPHLKPAAGAVLVEPDGRVWLACPSNGFGAAHVVPKGRQDHGASLKATALREVWEETGLQAVLVSWLVDASRSSTHTRYYLAKRVGGCPAAVGWESQAVELVPPAQLKNRLTSSADAAVVEAVLKALAG